MPRQQQQRQRQALADSVARLMREQGIQDFQLAKRKACAALGIKNGPLPDNREIAAALHLQESLFSGRDYPQRQQALLQLAMQLLAWLAPFAPRLSGQVAGGVITAHSRLQLHLFDDQPEAVDLFLQARGVDYRLEALRLRFSDGYRRLPAYCFQQQGTEITAVLFSLRQRSQAPLSPIDGRPMKRLSQRQLGALLENPG